MGTSTTSTSRPARPTSSVFSLKKLEESERAVTTAFYPHKASMERNQQQFRGILTVQNVGPITIGELDYNSEVSLDFPHITNGYHVNVPVEHSMSSRSRGREVHITPKHGAMYRKEADALLKASRRLHMTAVMFDSAALEQTLSALLGEPVEVDLELASGINLERGLGKEWWDLLSDVRRQIDGGNTLFSCRMVADPLAQSLMTGFLLASTHQFSEQLHSGDSVATPESLKLVEDAIMARLSESFTFTEIAQEVGISLRAIQRGFAHHIGTTPSQFVRTERLRRAHVDLVAGDPSTTRVADVAARWGFTHLGRFSAQYRKLYGVSPSDTLRS